MKTLEEEAFNKDRHSQISLKVFFQIFSPISIIEFVKVYQKKASFCLYDLIFCLSNSAGKNTTDRPIFLQLLAKLKKGDCLVIESYSRFSRNLQEALEHMDYLHKNGIELYSIDENTYFDS